MIVPPHPKPNGVHLFLRLVIERPNGILHSRVSEHHWAEQRTREEQAVVERADRDRQKATERAAAAAARRRELQTQLRGHLMPILIYWQVGDRCDQACELLLSQPMTERWIAGIRDRDLETLRQIFKLLLDRGLVDESRYPFKDTMPPKPIPKPSSA